MEVLRDARVGGKEQNIYDAWQEDAKSVDSHLMEELLKVGIVFSTLGPE